MLYSEGQIFGFDNLEGVDAIWMQSLGVYQCVAHFNVQTATTLMVGIALILAGTIPRPRL